MAEKINHFQELQIWRKDIKVVKDIYLLKEYFPKNELNW